jgi:hypothetical protein
MRWLDVRTAYPDQWLVIEGVEAHTEENQRVLDRIAVLETCSDGMSAMQSYRQLHQQFPFCEFYFVNTGRKKLEIRERHWVGIRTGDAIHM